MKNNDISSFAGMQAKIDSLLSNKTTLQTIQELNNIIQKSSSNFKEPLPSNEVQIKDKFESSLNTKDFQDTILQNIKTTQTIHQKISESILPLIEIKEQLSPQQKQLVLSIHQTLDIDGLSPNQEKLLSLINNLIQSINQRDSNIEQVIKLTNELNPLIATMNKIAHNIKDSTENMPKQLQSLLLNIAEKIQQVLTTSENLYNQNESIRKELINLKNYGLYKNLDIKQSTANSSENIISSEKDSTIYKNPEVKQPIILQNDNIKEQIEIPTSKQILSADKTEVDITSKHTSENVVTQTKNDTVPSDEKPPSNIKQSEQIPVQKQEEILTNINKKSNKTIITNENELLKSVSVKSKTDYTKNPISDSKTEKQVISDKAIPYVPRSYDEQSKMLRQEYARMMRVQEALNELEIAKNKIQDNKDDKTNNEIQPYYNPYTENKKYQNRWIGPFFHEFIPRKYWPVNNKKLIFGILSFIGIASIISLILFVFKP